MTAALLAVLMAGAPSALEAARAHLAEGKLEDVLFDLDGKPLAPPEKPAAAQVLGRAGETALAKDDSVLALQFAQMALRLNKEEPTALEAGARASRAQKLYGTAEEYADRWVEVTRRGARARLLRAEIAADQGDWRVGLDAVASLADKDLPDKERPLLRLVRETCRKQLAEQKASISSVKLLEQKMEAATEQAKKHRGDAPRPTAPASSREVVLYGTRWCGFCAQARAYFRRKGVQFVDKDVEEEPGAAEELAQKLAAAGKRAGGVPVIDVRGTLVVGFNRPELDHLLQL